MCAASSDPRAASDTDASASCEENQTRRDRRFNDRRQADVPAAVDGHGTLRPYAKCWCAACTCSREQKPTRTCSKKRRTQRHGTLVVHTCIVERYDGSGSGTLVLGQRPGGSMRWTGWTGFRIQTATSFFTRKQTCLTTVSHRSLGFLRLMDWKNRHETVRNKQKTMNSRGAVGTSTRAVACALGSKPRLPPPPRHIHLLSPARSNFSKPQLLI